VSFDPALVHRERRGFDWPVPASENTAGLGFLKIPVAQRRHGRFPPCVGLLRRIIALGQLAEFHLSEIACVLNRDRAEAPELDPAGPAVGISVLKDEGLEARVNDPDAEALQFAIPKEALFALLARWRQAFDGRLGQPPAHDAFLFAIRSAYTIRPTKNVSAM